VAQISTDSLVGDKFVDITGGKNPQTIPPGGEMIYKYQPELLKSLDLTQFTRQLRVIDQMLADIESGRNEFGQFYYGTSFYDSLIKRLNEVRRGIQASVKPTTTAGALLATDRLYRQVSETVAGIDNAIAQIQSGQGPAGRLLRSSAQYDQLLKQTQELHRTFATIDKSDLIQSDSLWSTLNATVAELNRNVEAFNQLPAMTTTATYDELNGSFRELRDGLRDFRLNPRKYMRMKLF
jgi:phospholipid/cholesterol/gamma-HCH transport system substrate-binding protein